MKIAIIGSGISGLASAHLLSPHNKVTLFEQDNRPGGHARTIEIPQSNLSYETSHSKPDTPLFLDTGFIVFNDRNYPNLNGLFNQLNVPFEDSDMSFGVSCNHGRLEYSSSTPFAQKRNLLNPAFLAMLRDIVKFNKAAPKWLATNQYGTLEDCVEGLNLGNWFKNYYIYPMGAAIWSTPVDRIMNFPAASFLRFFQNHGLLSLTNRPQWHTVTGGSHSYIRRLLDATDCELRLNTKISTITREKKLWKLTDTSGASEQFDHVILACHSTQAASLLKQGCLKSEQQQSALQKLISELSNIKFQTNQVITHLDKSLMPKNRAAWASWNYLQQRDPSSREQNETLTLSYWMNNLQNLNKNYPGLKDDIIITLNPKHQIKETLILDQHEFSHPQFDQAAIKAQQALRDRQGQHNLWLSGAWLNYGFHEDGITSAVNIAEKLGVKIPWKLNQ
ncbi:MAG: cyclopropane-fatty-acyl-phospholipid synthase [Rhodomicrobium sp.]|nr:MAG: cyclopropane-fatty-acyl-phospholipid synthase [Rhodomicrobium sp.]